MKFHDPFGTRLKIMQYQLSELEKDKKRRARMGRIRKRYPKWIADFICLWIA